KPTILLTRNEDDVPVDLKALRYVFYDVTHPEWGENLRSELARKVRDVLDSRFLSAHLDGIQTRADLPAAPSQALVEDKLRPTLPDLSGVWTTSWESVVSGRRHDATLMIPPNHGKDFTAAMTVVYVRDEQQTIVQETLTGAIRENNVALTGISYS